jgi:hypothetical protein
MDIAGTPILKRKEFFWMLLPCLLILGAGFYFMRHPFVPQEDLTSRPFRTIATSVQVLPATPREVSEGFDRKVEAIIGNEGQPILLPGAQLYPTPGTSFSGPMNVRLFQGDSPHPIPMPRGSVSKLGIVSNKQKAVVRLKLREIPLGKGDLVLKMQAALDTGCVVTTKGKKRYVPLKSRPADISVIVRRAGEKIELPQVSRVSPFVVERWEVEDASTTSFANVPFSRGDVTLHLYSLPIAQNSTAKTRFDFYDSHIETERGKRYFALRAAKPFDVINTTFHVGDKAKSKHFSFPLRLSGLSPQEGRLTFKTKISVNDCWPRQLSIIVREAGKKLSYAIDQKHPITIKPGDARCKVETIP